MLFAWYTAPSVNKQHIGETKRRHKDRLNRSSAKSPPLPFLNILSLVPGAYAAFSAAAEGGGGGGVHFKLVRPYVSSP